MTVAASHLEELGRHDLFASAHTPMALLDENGVFRAMNAAYLTATRSTRSQLMSRAIVEAFPDNPQTPEANSTQRLESSLERVLRSRRPDHMGFQRYDVPDRAEPGAFVAKTWVPVNSPVRRDGVMIGVLHRVDDITEFGEVALALSTAAHTSGGEECRGGGPVLSDTDGSAAQLQAVLTEAARLARENSQLREAIESRATIEEAKGMIMLECGCGPDAAFAFLTRISQTTNVRVADVATALTQHASDGRGRVREILGLATTLVEPPGPPGA